MRDIAPKNKFFRYLVFGIMMLPLIYLIVGSLFMIFQSPRVFFKIVSWFFIGGIFVIPILLAYFFIIGLIRRFFYHQVSRKQRDVTDYFKKNFK